jgi:GR25 family glycosyltransferase involved in LPS biosynthesis
MLSSVRGPSRQFSLFLIVSGFLLVVFLFSSVIRESTRINQLAHDTASYLKGTNDDAEEIENLVDDADAAWTIPFSTNSTEDLAIANRTLGFEKIFVLGLPDRLLKRDSMEMGASITNLDLTWMSGVDGMIPFSCTRCLASILSLQLLVLTLLDIGEKMHPKSVPPAHDDPKSRWFIWDSELGCWRGHLNIIHRMVKERIASALIMEDDADWDIHIVQQLQQFSNVSREYLAEDPNSTWTRKKRVETGSPYGEGWDILWFGHCGGYPARGADKSHIAVISNDNTVPPVFDAINQISGTNQKDKAKHPCSARKGTKLPPDVVCDSPQLADDERLIQERTSPLCTTGYAISLQGAQKMLARIGGLSLLDVTSPIDQEMKDMCR